MIPGQKSRTRFPLWLIIVSLSLTPFLPLASHAQSTVSIYSPTNNTTYLQPTNVPLNIQINVTVSSDFSNNTDLYDGTNYLGSTNLKGHHLLNWSNVTFGSHQLLAVHHASSGLVTSAVVNLQVNYGGWAVVPPGSIWTYLDGGVDPGPAWFAATYDTSFWPSGLAKFGFGDDDVVTWVNFRNPTNGSIFPTYYFRRAFVVTNASAHSNLAVRLRRDDGAVVYLNGEELFRDNLPASEITYWTYATRSVPDETIFMQRWIDPARLREGFNLLAVEIHNQAPTSEDIGFDLALVADIPVPAPTLQIQRLGTNVVLSWPIGYEGYSLESAASLAAGAGVWSRVTNASAMGQGKVTTTNRIDTAARFYRLRTE